MVNFKKIKTVNINGDPIELDLDWQINSKFYLRCISMPRKKPINLTDAANMCLVFVDTLIRSKQFKEAAFFYQEDDWAEFISQQGYHIEFSPEDFDLEKMSS